MSLNRPVPDDLRGVWVRTLLQTETQDGGPPETDTTTWVRWLQTSLWHADLRIPAHAQAGRQALPLSALPAPQLAALAAQQGSAGITQFEALPEGQICTWLRRIDYQPPGLYPDAGWMVSDHPDQFIEIGVHDYYNEVWRRLPDSVGRFVVLANLDEAQQAVPCRLLVAGAYLMLVRGRSARWPRGMAAGYTLTDVLVGFPQEACGLLDCEVSFGRLAQGTWQIEHSTLPEREGLSLPCTVRRDEGEHSLAHVSLDGFPSQGQVIEWTCEHSVLT